MEFIIDDILLDELIFHETVLYHWDTVVGFVLRFSQNRPLKLANFNVQSLQGSLKEETRYPENIDDESYTTTLTTISNVRNSKLFSL